MKRLLSILLLLIAATVSGCQKPPPAPIECGGASNFQCPSFMFCRLGAYCGGIDQSGICVPQPTNCQDVIQEVCGCDRKTYENGCWANARGITVMREGACEGPKSEPADSNIPTEEENSAPTPE